MDINTTYNHSIISVLQSGLVLSGFWVIEYLGEDQCLQLYFVQIYQKPLKSANCLKMLVSRVHYEFMVPGFHRNACSMRWRHRMNEQFHASVKSQLAQFTPGDAPWLRRRASVFQRQHSQVTEPPCLSCCIYSLGLPSSSGWSRTRWDTVCDQPQEDPLFLLHTDEERSLFSQKPRSSYLCRVWTSWTARLTSNTYRSFTTKCERVISGLGKFWDKT